MYYATKRNNNTTRLVGLATVVLVNVGAGLAILNGFGVVKFAGPIESEVVIIEEVPELEDEPPPPPPIDVDLPPPPPQVILPDFVFETPPKQEAAITADPVPNPAPPPPKAAPTPPPRPPLPTVRPVPNKNRFADMMTNDYPARALRAKQEGDVTVSMCVSVDGRASDVKLIQSSGIEALDEATVKGMTKLSFTPAKDGTGKAVAWCTPAYQLTVSWKLPKN